MSNQAESVTEGELPPLWPKLKGSGKELLKHYAFLIARELIQRSESEAGQDGDMQGKHADGDGGDGTEAKLPLAPPPVEIQVGEDENKAPISVPAPTQGEDEAKARLARRKVSMIGSCNPAQQQAFIDTLDVTELMKEGLGNATKEQCLEAGQQLVAVIRNSGGDVVGDVKGWVAKSFPTGNMSQKEKDNLAEIFGVVGKELRTASKMARIGVALKIMLTLVLGYADVVTDFLVAKSY
ncbi:hypothetical protein TrST_g10472 [Triparma strigata]|uniref:Uncharacterized protein n=1 Tax=Triparma strigata TaxID=1606541 RepID=A0A9W7EAP1_9STRA|nr:hypothetical protein TrST_g10472 [Triparma strigata]